MRANVIVDRDTWLTFKMMAGKYEVVEDGKRRQATASDVVRELIADWMIEHKHLIPKLIEELKHSSPNSRIRKFLEELNSEGEK